MHPANAIDAFLTNFKESMAYRLAEERAKRDEQMKKREQKAMEDYRNLQMMMNQAQQRAAMERQRKMDEFAKRQYEEGAPMREAELEQTKKQTELMGQPKSPEEPTWAERQRIAQGWARIAEGGTKSPKVESLDAKIVSLINKVGQSENFGMFTALQSAESQDELDMIYNQYAMGLPENDIYGGTKANFDALYRYMADRFGRGAKNVPKTEGSKETETDSNPLKLDL
jgi:hypothetical protein